MSERTPDINKMIDEEIEKLGGPTNEGETPVSGIKESTLEERIASRRAREESRETDAGAAEKIRKEISGETDAEEAVEVVGSEKIPSDASPKREEADIFDEENAELVGRAEEMKKSMEAGKPVDDSGRAELFRSVAETVIKEHGQDFLPAMEKLAGRYRGNDGHLTSMDKGLKVIESWYPEFKAMMGGELSKSPEAMVSRLKSVIETRLGGQTSAKREAESTESGKLAGDLLMDFQSRRKTGETIDPREFNRAFDNLAKRMVAEKFSDLDEDATRQLARSLSVSLEKLFVSLASMQDLKPETAANFQRKIDENIERMSPPRAAKDFSRVEKSSEGRLRKFFRRMFGGR